MVDAWVHLHDAMAWMKHNHFAETMQTINMHKEKYIQCKDELNTENTSRSFAKIWQKKQLVLHKNQVMMENPLLLMRKSKDANLSSKSHLRNRKACLYIHINDMKDH